MMLRLKRSRIKVDVYKDDCQNSNFTDHIDKKRGTITCHMLLGFCQNAKSLQKSPAKFIVRNW